MTDPASAALFTETPFVRKKLRRQMLAKVVLGTIVALILIPLFLIVGYLVKEGASLISWRFPHHKSHSAA